MNNPQILIFAILTATMGLFLWGRFRHDVVALGLLPAAAAAFTLGVLASMVLRTVPLRQIYTFVDWPVVVLLAALIPVAGAMQSTGAAEVLARFLVWPL